MPLSPMELSVNTPMFSLEDDTNTVYDRTPVMATIGSRLASFNDRMEYRNLETRLVVSHEAAQEHVPADFVAIEFEQFPTEDETFSIRQELIMSGLYMRAHLDPGKQTIESTQITVGMLEVMWTPLYDNLVEIIERIKQPLRVRRFTITKTDELGETTASFFMSAYSVPRANQDMVLDEIGLPMRVKLNEALASDGFNYALAYSKTVGERVYVFIEETDPGAGKELSTVILSTDDYNDIIARAESDPLMLPAANQLHMRTELLTKIIDKHVRKLQYTLGGPSEYPDMSYDSFTGLQMELEHNGFIAAAAKLHSMGGVDKVIRGSQVSHLYVMLTMADYADEHSAIL